MVSAEHSSLQADSPQNGGSREGFLYLGGDTDIGQQHEFLNQTVGFALLFLLDVDRLCTL